MPNPVVHFEIRSPDPDATRKFFGQLFGWAFPDGGIPGYSYVNSGVEGAIRGLQVLQLASVNGQPLITALVSYRDPALAIRCGLPATLS